jgi:hypothetical protein
MKRRSVALAFLLCGLAIACEPPERIDVGTLGPLIDTRPVVAVRNDRAVVAWHRSGNEIRVSNFASGGPFTAPRVLGTGVFPEVALSSAGIAHVIYRQPSVGLFASRRDSANIWTSPQMLTTSGTSAYGIGADGLGGALAVWVQGGIRARRYNLITGWGPEMLGDTANPSMLAVATNNSGTAVVAWCDGTQIRARRYVPGTGWSGPTFSSTGCCPNGTPPIGNLGVSAGIAEDGRPVVVGGSSERVCAFAGGYWTTLSAPGPLHWTPHVAVNASGSAMAAWVTGSGYGDAIQARVYQSGVGWGALLTRATSVDLQNIGVGFGSSGNGAILFNRGGDVYYSTYNSAAPSVLNAPAALASAAGASYYLRVGFDPTEPNQGVTVWRQEGGAAIGAEVWASRLGL